MASIPIGPEKREAGMIRARVNKFISIVISIVLVSAFALPASAFADTSSVKVENHTISTGQKPLTDITIDGVDAPLVGHDLDDVATVTAADDVKWDIPAIWVGDDMQLATRAQEGRNYLPALVFFVPEGYSVSGNDYTVSLSDSLTKLFGGEEVVSVYDDATGITYILPASLRDFFTRSTAQDAVVSGKAEALAPGQDGASSPQAGEGQIEEQPNRQPTLIEIHCAQTARDAFSDEDLEWFLDLVINKLQPQAVNLLLEKFPAFRAAADLGQIGKEISLYVYYKSGDDDGVREHRTPANALAYVTGDVANRDGSLKYCYMLGIDLKSLAKKDASGNPVRDSNGKLILERVSYDMMIFENTIVHEMFHAFMDDYNRTGMLGAFDLVGGYTPDGEFTSLRQKELYGQLRYPSWFREGTASAVENNYQFRRGVFQTLRASDYTNVATGWNATFTDQLLFNNYLLASANGQRFNFALDYAMIGDGGDTSSSYYVSGYLACLYLGELSARKLEGVGTSVSGSGAATTFDSAKIRLGLNSILQRMHNGETLDQVIKDISTTVVSGVPTPLYADTADFEQKFIRGGIVEEGDGKYYKFDNRDTESCTFVVGFLNYMLGLETSDSVPNGSILYDFDRDFGTPLDASKAATADFFKIVSDNALHASTVPDAVAFAGGGRSTPTAATSSAESQEQTRSSENPVTIPVPASESEGSPAETTPAVPGELAGNDESSENDDAPEGDSLPADGQSPSDGDVLSGPALPLAAKIEAPAQ